VNDRLIVLAMFAGLFLFFAVLCKVGNWISARRRGTPLPLFTLGETVVLRVNDTAWIVEGSKLLHGQWSYYVRHPLESRLQVACMESELRVYTAEKPMPLSDLIKDGIRPRKVSE